MAYDPDTLLTTTSLPLQHRVRRLAGRRAQPDIRAVASAAVLSFGSGVIYTWSLFLVPMAGSLGTSTAALTTAFTASLLAMTVTVVFAGRLAQRAPRPVVMSAAAGTALAASATGLASGLGVLVVAVSLLGAAGGLAYAVATGVAAAALPRHRGLSIGFVITGAAAGPVLLGPLASVAISAVGWRPTIVGLGLVLAAAMAVAGRNIEDGVAEGRAVDDRVAPPQDSAHRRLVTPLLWCIFLLVAVIGLGVYGHAASIAAAGGLPMSLTGFAVAALSAGDVSGRLFAAAATEPARTRALLSGALVVTVGAATLAGIAGAVSTIVGLAFVGAGYGSVAALVPANLSDHVRRDEFSRVYGVVFTSWGLAALVGPLGAATLERATGGHQVALAVALAVGVAAVLVASTLYLVLRRRGTAVGSAVRYGEQVTDLA